MSQLLQNCKWPLQRGGAHWAQVNDAPRIEAAIDHLLHTPYGSLIWAPTYGTRIGLVRTQGMVDDDLTNILQPEISSSIARWIRGIALLELAVRALQEEQKLEITIVWGITSGTRSRRADTALSTGPRKLVVLV